VVLLHQGRGGPEIKSKKNEATNGREVEGRGFEEIGGLE